MLDKKSMLDLMKTVAHAKPSAPVAYSLNGENYSYADLNETLRKELNEYAGSYELYRENKNTIFSLIEETISDVLPAKVQEAYGAFAEVQTFNQGDKPIFRRKISARNRAKQFVTRVGLAGKYEVFKLGGEESFEVPTGAIGAGVQISIEEFLDKKVDFAELIDVVMEGMDELIYQEVQAAMIGAIGQLPTVNQYSTNSFDEVAFDALLTIASSYGVPTIYCTNEFAVQMIPKEAWRYSDDMKNELYRTGRLASYKGYKVIILPQAFGELNDYRKIDPSYCWIIPSGIDNKPVKIAFEGGTMTKEVENDDWSRSIHIYKKVGVVAMLNNGICCYKNTALSGKSLLTNGLKVTPVLTNPVTVSAVEATIANTEENPVPTKEITGE